MERLRTWLTVAGCAVWAAYFALRIALYVPTHHLDGAFQSASGLFRLSAGHLPGADFFPYLGVGPVYALYPLFVLFGQHLAASVAAVHMMMIACGVLLTAALVHFVARPRSALLVGAVVFTLPAAVAFETAWFRFPEWFTWLIWPGNSLRPMRGVIPYAVALVIAWLWERTTWRYAWAGVVAGAAMLWSNDYAAPTLLVTSAVIALAAWRERDWRGLATYAAIVPVAVAAWLMLATAGHAGDLIAYNRGVAHDQWWYFAQYSDYRRVFGWRDLGKIFDVLEPWPLVVLAGAIAVAAWLRTRRAVIVAALGVAVLGGGLVASIGGHLNDGYFGPLRAWAGMTCVAVAFAVVQRFSRLAWFVAALAVFAGGVSAARYRECVAEAVISPSAFYVPELGGFLDRAWSPYVSFVREHASADVYEEYWGLWSAMTRRFSAWPVDAAIHALGPVRETAARQLRTAELIVTTSPQADPFWQSWNLSQNGWLYEPLLFGWQVVTTSPTTVVWRRSVLPPPRSEVVPCLVAGGGRGFVINARAAGYVEVEISYSVRNPTRALVMVQNNLSMGADAGGFVSVDASRSVATFPAYTPGMSFRFFALRSSPNAAARLVACRAWALTVDPEVQPTTTDGFLTDMNWTRGIARMMPAFFVANTEEHRRSFAAGRQVVFSNWETRQIVEARANGPYLEVYVDGGMIDPSTAGLPNTFVTVGKASRVATGKRR